MQLCICFNATALLISITVDMIKHVQITVSAMLVHVVQALQKGRGSSRFFATGPEGFPYFKGGSGEFRGKGRVGDENRKVG